MHTGLEMGELEFPVLESDLGVKSQVIIYAFSTSCVCGDIIKLMWIEVCIIIRFFLIDICGFCQKLHFILHCFKDHFGVTPLQKSDFTLNIF